MIDFQGVPLIRTRSSIPAGAGDLIRKPRQQGGRRGAYRDVFTAFFESDHLLLQSILYVFK